MVIAAALLAAMAWLPAALDAQRAPITARDLVEVAEIMGPRLSPDGRWVAYRVSRPSVERNATELDWYVVDIEGGDPVHVGSGGLARHDGAGVVLEQAPVWDRDSRGLRFLARVDGVVGIWHWRAGGSLRREIAGAADILDFKLSNDGRALRYTTGATRAEVAAAQRRAYEDGIVVDDTLNVHHPLVGGMVEGPARSMMRFTGKWFETAPLLWQAPRKDTMVVFDERGQIAQGATTTARFADAPAANQGDRVQFGNGDTAQMLGEQDARQVEVVRADGARIACKAALCHSSRLVAIAAPPGRDLLLLFEALSGGRERIWRWRVGDDEAHEVALYEGAPRSPDRPWRCDVGPDALVCAEARAIVPPRLTRIDYATGATRVLADPNRAFAARIAAEAVPMDFGEDRLGTLLRPRQVQGPVPLVVTYTYCAGFLKGGTGDEQPLLPLVEHGIAVLCMHPQSRTGQNREAVYDASVDAIGAAIDRLAEEGVIDRERVGIGGLSFSTEVTMWNIRHSKRFAAAVLSSSLFSPFYYWTNAVPDRGFTRMLQDYWGIGDPEADRARWAVHAPVWDIDSIDTPLLMQVPESEFRNLIELHTKLKLAGKPAELIAFADEVHIKHQPVHKRAVYERNLDWYRFWLKDEEDASPAKAAQYARWRAMRSDA